MKKKGTVFRFVLLGTFVLALGLVPGCPLPDGMSVVSLQKALGGCSACRQDDPAEGEQEGEGGDGGGGCDSPNGPTQHWKSRETIGNIRGNLGIYLDIRLDANGNFDGKIGNYIYQYFPGFGGHYATYPDLQKGVCGKLDLAAGTGVVGPEGEEKTNVIVRRLEGDTRLIVTFVEWPALEGTDPPGATMWKM